MLAVTILGNNSAVPAFDRHPTSQVVTLDGFNFLVDCGEGTQIQMINYKIRRSRISHIFISHLHGDHYFGLIGLINSFSLLGRQQELHIVGPAPLQQLIEFWRAFQLSIATSAGRGARRRLRRRPERRSRAGTRIIVLRIHGARHLVSAGAAHLTYRRSKL